ncbi:amino acid adenylation domain-containing protein [Streptomyces ehimensis]|uniref:Amino acid adenylation domain-containing protein n=1 Tax=Streptomyces ehimensis TaxID=68195 RepID=A0ABV9BTF3_9ACTN
MTTDTAFVLSPQQRRTWLSQHTVDGAPWSWTCDIEIRGAVDASRLRQAIAALVERHEILRTTYQTVAGLDAPVQVVGPPRPVTLEEGADRFESQDVRAIEQPLRASLTDGADGVHRLRLQGPGLSLDVPAIARVAAEVARGYGGRCTATDDEPPQYADVAEWLNELLQADDTAAGRDYWRRLAAGPGVSGRPPFLGRGELGDRRTFRGRRLRVAADRIPTVDDARSVMLAAWSILLYRYGGQEESLLAVAHPGRRHPALENAIGAFTRYVPLAVTLGADTTVEEAIRRVAEADAEAERYQDYFTRETWAGVRPGSMADLDVGFDYHELPARADEHGCVFAIERIEDATDLFDIRLRCLRSEDGIEAFVEYNADRVRSEDASGLVAALDVLLDEMLVDPVRPIGRLPLTAAPQVNPQHRVLSAAASQPGIADRFAERTRRQPTATAVEHQDERYTYQELDRWAGSTAEALGRMDAGPGTVVAILLDRGPAVIAAILGCLRAGAAYTVVDTALPMERIRFLLDDSAACAVLTDASWAARIPVDLPVVVLRSGGCQQRGAAAPPRVVVPADTAYVMYTSGTTGTPKGALVGQANLAAYVSGLVDALGLDESLSYGHVSTFAADLGNSVLFPALCAGGRLVIATRDEMTDAERLGRLMRDAAVDVLKIVPSHLGALLQASRSPVDLLPRRFLITGGEALDRELLDRVRALDSPCQVINHYGPTETTVGATLHRVDRAPLDERLSTAPIGGPLGGATVYVVDSAMQEVPAWVTGEILIGGTGVAHGYHDRPGPTAERFLPDPFGATAGGRLYRTGDLARRLPSGELQFIGRADGQVKISGYRVELGEIEAVAAGHADVRQCVAIVDPRRGRAGVVLYVTTGGAPLDVDGFRAHLAARLPSHMQPSVVVPLDRFPLTANGKVDRAALPVPETGVGVGREPADDLERILLRIWRDVLGHPTIGVTDDFFRSGGTSLSAIRLMAEIEKGTGVNLPLSTLLEASTVETLASRVRDRLDPAVHPGERADGTPPFFCIHAGGGGVLAYHGLARAMAPERMLVGIEAFGLRPGGTMPADMAEMARAYAQEIRECQPVGPYLVGGWCLGGIIAHEVAQQLARQGETVAALVVLDSAAPSASLSDEHVDVEPGTGAEDEEAEVLARFAWHYQLDLDDAKLSTMSSEERFTYLLDRARRTGIVPEDAGDERLRRLLAVYSHNLRVADEYMSRWQRTETARFPVLLLRAEDDPIWPDLDAALGWAELYGDLVDVTDVAGDHHTMLRTDRAARTAGHVTAYLNDATNRLKETSHDRHD